MRAFDAYFPLFLIKFLVLGNRVRMPMPVLYRIAPQPESDHEIQIASLPRLAVFLPRSPEGDIT